MIEAQDHEVAIGLTEEVVLQVLGAIANTADGLDEEIVAAHGGRRATDPSTEEQP